MEDLRVALGVTQKALAKRAGVRPPQMSNWIRGIQSPPQSRLEAWADREGWPVDMFAEGGRMPSKAVSSPAAGQTYEGTARRARASDYATAAVLPPSRGEALEILELKMKLAVKENRLVTRDEMLEWLRLAELATRPDAVAGGAA